MSVSVALVIQQARRMRHIIICGLPLPYFFTLSPKFHDFREKVTDIKYVFRFSLQFLYDILLILRKIQRHNDIDVHPSSRKVPVILVRL